MKLLIGVVVGLLGSILVIWGDVNFVKYVFTLVPENGYSGLIKIAILLFDVWLTLGICILPFIIGFAVGAIWDNN